MNREYVLKLIKNQRAEYREDTDEGRSARRALALLADELTTAPNDSVDAQLVRDYFEAQAACDALNMIKQPAQFRDASAHLDEAQNALWAAAGMETPK